MRPFWGWKRALEDAGLDYAKINLELRDYVRCEVCGQDFGALTWHLFHRHEMTPEDYRLEYPEAELACETLRARMGKFSSPPVGRAVMPHWEAIWTPEYILDRMAELRRRNFPMSHAWARRHEPSLAERAIEHIGSWDEALRRIGMERTEVGLHPLAWRRKTRWWVADKAAILAELHRRQAAGETVSSQKILHVKHGPAIFDRAGDLFGSWSAALTAAGLEPWGGFRSHWGEAAKAAVLAEVRRRERAGESVRYKDIQKEKWGKPLLRRATALFGSWTAALLAVGIEPKAGKSPWPEADKATVLAELHRRKRAGETLGYTAVGKETWGVPLRERCESLFGSWAAALHTAGIEPARQHTPWARADKAMIRAEIHRRKRAGQSLRYSDIENEKWGPPLLTRCKTLFGSWRFALHAAGVPSPKGSTSPYVRADKGVVLAEIRRRQRARESLRYGKIQNEQWGQALLRRATKLFGSWEAALTAARVAIPDQPS